jgi:hypothetical protein
MRAADFKINDASLSSHCLIYEVIAEVGPDCHEKRNGNDETYLLTTDELLKRIRKRPVLSSALTDLLCPLQAKFTILEPLCIALRRECERALTRSVQETRSNSASSTC